MFPTSSGHWPQFKPTPGVWTPRSVLSPPSHLRSPVKVVFWAQEARQDVTPPASPASSDFFTQIRNAFPPACAPASLSPQVSREASAVTCHQRPVPTSRPLHQPPATGYSVSVFHLVMCLFVSQLHGAGACDSRSPSSRCPEGPSGNPEFQERMHETGGLLSAPKNGSGLPPTAAKVGESLPGQPDRPPAPSKAPGPEQPPPHTHPCPQAFGGSWGTAWKPVPRAGSSRGLAPLSRGLARALGPRV